MHFRNVKFEGKKDNGGPWCYLSNDEDILAVGKTWDYCNVIESCPDNETDASDANPGKKLNDFIFLKNISVEYPDECQFIESELESYQSN